MKFVDPNLKWSFQANIRAKEAALAIKQQAREEEAYEKKLVQDRFKKRDERLARFIPTIHYKGEIAAIQNDEASERTPAKRREVPNRRDKHGSAIKNAESTSPHSPRIISAPSKLPKPCMSNKMKSHEEAVRDITSQSSSDSVSTSSSLVSKLRTGGSVSHSQQVLEHGEEEEVTSAERKSNADKTTVRSPPSPKVRAEEHVLTTSRRSLVSEIVHESRSLSGDTESCSNTLDKSPSLEKTPREEAHELELFKALEEAVDAEATPKSKMSTSFRSKRTPLQASGVTNQFSAHSVSPAKLNPLETLDSLSVHGRLEESNSVYFNVADNNHQNTENERLDTSTSARKSTLLLSGVSEFADILDDVDEWLN